VFSAEALLTREDEQRLAEAVRRGDPEAFRQFVSANLRLVICIARHFRGRGLDFDDLIGEGNLGLIRAVKQFDPSVGTRFSTYAAYWIKESIRRALNETATPIRLPAFMVALLRRWHREEWSYRNEHGRSPSRDELAEILGLTRSQRRMVERALQAGQFLPGGGEEADHALDDQPSSSREDPRAAVDARDQFAAIRGRMGRLDDRERVILSMHFGLDGAPPQAFKQIAQDIGMTREWIRKLEIRAVRKLGDDFHEPCHPDATPPVAVS
jgi:RNA polymerase primary sigma factor